MLDFLIVGTMKSGTSSLSKYLNQNNAVFIPKKEVHFFDQHFSKGLDWYKNVLTNDGEVNKSVLIGEKTPWYAWEDWIAKQLFQLNPELKLIWLFRDPIKRILSHYQHNIARGYEYYSLEKALQNENRRIKRNLQLGYVNASDYETQVNRYLKYFPEEQMYFQTFERFKNEPKAVLKEIEQFLGVENQVYVDLKPKNVAMGVSNYKLLYLTRAIIGDKNRVWNYVYRNTRSDLKRKPTLSKQAIQDLVIRLYPTVSFIEKECKLDISKWNYFKV